MKATLVSKKPETSDVTTYQFQTEQPVQWTGKPIGIMGASDGQFGTQTAQFDLRRILTHTGAMIMPQPQVYVAKAQEKLNQGKFDEATIKVVGRYMQALAKWTERNAQDK